MIHLDLRNPDLAGAVLLAGKFRLTLQAYLGPYRVIGEADYGSWERYSVERAKDWVEAAVTDGIAQLNLMEIQIPSLTGLRAHGRDGSMRSMILSDEDGVVLGGKFGHLPYIRPEFRGQGHGGLLAFLTDLSFTTERPTHYSEQGFRARLRAHAMHVTIADLSRPRRIPKTVRRQYGEDGKPRRLLEPWLSFDQNAMAALAEARRRKKAERRRSGSPSSGPGAPGAQGSVKPREGVAGSRPGRAMSRNT